MADFDSSNISKDERAPPPGGNWTWLALAGAVASAFLFFLERAVPKVIAAIEWVIYLDWIVKNPNYALSVVAVTLLAILVASKR